VPAPSAASSARCSRAPATPSPSIARAAARRGDRALGLRVERSSGEVETVPIGASVDLAAVRGADLVLFCVKSTDTDAVAEAMAPHLGDGALVLSLQNGVENAATIARHVRAPSCPRSSTSRRRCPSPASCATTAAATS
jgi:2-dehydropantoate 2-reductase